MNRNQAIKSIKEQFQQAQERGYHMCFEYELPENEWLLVHLEMTDKGVEFRFDENNLPTWFSGDVIKTGDGVYLIKVNEDNDNLDNYLQLIDDEMKEGFLIPNNLYV